jgi:hypothetical protein
VRHRAAGQAAPGRGYLQARYIFNERSDQEAKTTKALTIERGESIDAFVVESKPTRSPLCFHVCNIVASSIRAKFWRHT